MSAHRVQPSDRLDSRTVNEVLASQIETSAKDDSFALVHSILLNGDLELETRPFWNLPLKAGLGVVGFGLKAIGDIWRWQAPKTTPKMRLLLGPEWLNDALGHIHPMVRIVREGVTTSAALDALYAANVYFRAYFRDLAEHPECIPAELPHIPGALLTWAWCNLPGPMAVRNRLRITYMELLQEFHRQADLGKRKIRVLELACGSAEAEICALWKFCRERPEVQMELTLVDMSRSSLQRAKRLAEHLGVDQFLVFPAEGNLQKYLATRASNSVDVGGVIGFYDYRPSNSIIGLSREMHRVVVPGGVFIGAMYLPNDAEGVTRNVFGWPGLIPRTVGEYRSILVTADWSEEIKMVVEPLEEFVVSVVRKTA